MLNPNDLPGFVNRCQMISRANICATEMLARNGTCRTRGLLHILNNCLDRIAQHEIASVLRQRVAEIPRVNGQQALVRFRVSRSFLLQEGLEKLLWRRHAIELE